VPPYRPGEFYLRELPPLRAVLDGLSGLGLLVVDGYADLDPDGRPGLGAHAHAEFGIPVIGVAKSGSAPRPTRCRSRADPRYARCSSPPPGCPAPTRRTWSGAWPAGTGCPTPCADTLARAGPTIAAMTGRQPG
jgi:Endonuclease V